MRCRLGEPVWSDGPVGIERPFDLHAPDRHRGIPVAGVVIRLRRADGLEHALGDGTRPQERERHLATPRRHRQSEVEVGVGVPLVRCQVEDRVPRLTLAIGADLELGDAGPIESHFEPVAPL